MGAGASETLLEGSLDTGRTATLAERTVRTLEVMHRWGYAPSVERLAEDLLGGPLSAEDLWPALARMRDITTQEGFVCLRSHEPLLEKSKRRVESNKVLNGAANAIAEEFASGLLRICPLVDCIALSGSAASGGFEATDDVDFNLFVQDGAKYFTYSLALLLGLKASLRHSHTGGLRKITCINVLWTRRETSPFSRRDEDLAFELLRSRPIYGSSHFREVITSNPWTLRFFPQLEWTEFANRAPPSLGGVGRIVGWIGRHPTLLAIVDRLGRGFSHAAYSFAHWMKRNDPQAMERLAFLRRVKFPYEVFQD